MSANKSSAKECLKRSEGMSDTVGTVVVLMGIVYALLFIGEVLEKYLKEIATNTKRIGNS